MDERYEVRLAGEGGQGLQLAGVILSEAVCIYEGKGAVMAQSYTSQQRGGPSRAEVIISDGEIDYPKAKEPDLLVVLSQDAYNRHHANVKSTGLIVADSFDVKETSPVDKHIYLLPMTEACREATGGDLGISIVALGVVTELRFVSYDAMLKALMARVPRGSEEMNRKALEAGMKLVAGLKLPATVRLPKAKAKVSL